MPENRIEGKDPLWMLMEEQIQKHADEDFSDANKALLVSDHIEIGERVTKPFQITCQTIHYLLNYDWRCPKVFDDVKLAKEKRLTLVSDGTLVLLDK